MPPEPKKPIEKLLEASAQARRAEFGADPKMPNPMRARLQDEIATQARDGRTASPTPWFSFSWPRLAVGAAFAALVLSAAAIWWQTEKNPGASARFAAEERLAAPPRPAAPAEMDKLADAGSTAGQPALAESAARADTDAKAKSESRQSFQNQGQVAAAPASAAAGAVAQASEKAVANLRQQFSQAAANKTVARNEPLKQGPRILDNFQVEQNGRDFRVVDEDGSTYLGHIERLTRDDARNLAKEKKSEAAPQDEFYFRASGYNDSLKKTLVFEGNYIVGPPGASKDLAPAGKNDEAQTAARIVGTAQVPGEPPVPVDAITVPPK